MNAVAETLPRFSLDPHLIADVLRHARPLGHHEDPSTLNLGFGFLYYGLVRTLRPRHVVVIGSGFGFSVVCLALGVKDNAEGRVTFVDPSYSLVKNGPFQTIGGTSQWDDPGKVRAHFARFGVGDVVDHYRETSAEFFVRYPGRGFAPIDLAFIDGNHSFADVRHDFVAVTSQARRDSYILLHDTHLYLREFIRHAGVKRWMNLLARERDAFEVVDFPFASGVGIVRMLRDGPWRPAA